MFMKKGNIYEFKIEDIEFPFKGISHCDGRKVCIRNSIPGEKVTAKIIKKRSSGCEGKIVDIIDKSESRKNPDCPHFEFCGGCLTQNMTYEKQLELKEYQVKSLFKKAGIDDFEFCGIERSPEIYGYRNKMEFTFGDFEKGGELSLGMHKRKSTFSIVSTPSCILVDSDFNDILSAVLDYFKKVKLPHYRVLSSEGYLRNLVIRKGKNTSEILVNIVTTSQINFDFSEITKIILNLDLKGNIKGILHSINDSLSDAVKIEKEDILYGRDYIFENVLGLKFKINPLSFFQTNTKGAEELYSIVRNFMGSAEDKVVFDLYCGTGTIGQIAASKAKKVIGVEIIEDAVKSAKENARLNNIKNCTFIAGDVENVIESIEEKPDIIIIDPPRPGVTEKSLSKIVKFNPSEIIYVSCNPKTLVKDLKYIENNGYKTVKVKCMDMFPQTWHVETVVLLSKQKPNDRIE